MDTAESRTPSGENLRRRRSHIINPVFQWKYTLLMSGSVFFVSTFMSVILFSVLHHQARARIVHPEVSYMWENTLAMVFSSLGFAALTALAIGCWCIFITHRVAGPMYVLEAYLREIIDGRLPKVRALRKKDEFKELHDTFRKAVDAVRIRQHDDLATLTETLKIARSSAAGDEKKQKHAFEAIAIRLERLRAEAARTLGEKVDCVPADSAAATVAAAEEAFVTG